MVARVPPLLWPLGRSVRTVPPGREGLRGQPGGLGLQIIPEPGAAGSTQARPSARAYKTRSRRSGPHDVPVCHRRTHPCTGPSEPQPPGTANQKCPLCVPSPAGQEPCSADSCLRPRGAVLAAAACVRERHTRPALGLALPDTVSCLHGDPSPTAAHVLLRRTSPTHPGSFEGRRPLHSSTAWTHVRTPAPQRRVRRR